jgi:signal transduction histidine kinase
VCHEFRAPVSSLGSLTRALSDGGRRVTPHVRQQIAQLAHDHAVHLDGLLRQAAAVTDGLAPPLAARRLPLHRVVPAAAAVVPRQRLSTMVSADAAHRVVDAQRVQHILTNLLENAVRHGPAGGQVRLGAWIDRRGLVLTVCDQGSLTPALSDALHRPGTPAGMSGLGLWVVRRLVADQNGTVAARDNGRGLLIEVVLPRPGSDPTDHRADEGATI